MEGESCFARDAVPLYLHTRRDHSTELAMVFMWIFYLEETQRAIRLMVEEDISSIYQMLEVNPDIRHSELFLTRKAKACR